MKRIYQKAFTLIELLIVVAILGILSAAVLVAIDPAAKIGQAKDANIKSDISSISNAMQAYYTSSSISGSGCYPITVSFLADPSVGEMKTSPKNPSGQEYSVQAFNSSGGPCTAPSVSTGCPATNNCTDVAVYTLLNKHKASGNTTTVWCWRASLGKIGETEPDNCINSTPDPAEFL